MSRRSAASVSSRRTSFTIPLIDGTATIDRFGADIFQMMLDCASGTRSKSELHGYGQNEFVPWQVGVVT